jgi:hypothetical protein
VQLVIFDTQTGDVRVAGVRTVPSFPAFSIFLFLSQHHSRLAAAVVSPQASSFLFPTRWPWQASRLPVAPKVCHYVEFMMGMLISDVFSWNFRTLDREKQHGRVRAVPLRRSNQQGSENKFLSYEL